MGSRIRERPDSTFELYLEVSSPEEHSSGPEVRRQFPMDYTEQETLRTVPRFCFPFNMESLSVNQVGHNFTFVLTDIDSKQRFGFCRLSSGAKTCYCILSYLPWFEVFYKLLSILADYRVKGQESQWEELLVSLHSLPVPSPGVPVHLGVHSFFTVPDSTELPSIPENRNLTEYFVAVDVNNMLHLYASMLYERRILICCSKLSTLTACVHGSAAMLNPMHWQHVYIPVLPQHLLDYCCAPMPYLIGVHSSLMEKVRGMVLDDVVILNVDTNTLETPFEDLQSLPNDVISSMKTRLKKVSTTTGDGVARAFLKSQAALFGSYRNALQIEPGAPITFNEETFMNHRSTAMRQFLQNAIHLQFFKQFIDGRLDLLNSGEGFSDLFEEEISMGEYAGSDRMYHQWLFTVKKGGGAIFNTVKTKANPAMKTVYKFAKDHAKMRIKDVRSRLKQKEQTENGLSSGCSSVIGDESTARIRREESLAPWDDPRPITVHFGQARAPILLKRPSSNLSLENSIDQPQPYRSLKEVELMDADHPGFGAESQTAPPSPVNENFSNINLLGDIFGCQDEPESQTVTMAKSLEDLRTPKDSDLRANFTYQQMDLCIGDSSSTLPGLKLSSPHKKLWLFGHSASDGPACIPAVGQSDNNSLCCESSGSSLDPLDCSVPGSITIPRPHGRKTPELGSVLAPLVASSSKAAEGRTTPGGQEFRQALTLSSDRDLLRSVQTAEEGGDLIRLLDPLNSSTQSGSDTQTGVVQSSVTHGQVGISARSYPQNLLPVTLHPHTSLNPFAPPQQHYSPAVGGNPFNVVYGPPLSQPTSFAMLPKLYRQPSPGSLAGLPGYGPLPSSPFLSPNSLPHSPRPSNHGCNTPPVPASAASLIAKAQHAEAQDPFEDLLTIARPATPTKKEVENLRRNWETFD